MKNTKGLDTWMTREGPPLTISGGIWERGQFSMLMICRLVHNASSKGKLCRFGLSLMYNDSRFSSVPAQTHGKNDKHE